MTIARLACWRSADRAGLFYALRAAGEVEQRPNFASFSAHFHDTIVNEGAMEHQRLTDERGNSP